MSTRLKNIRRLTVTNEIFLEITLLDLLYLSQVRYFIYLFIIYTALKAVT